MRVFALGGSTTQGEPYSTETAFPEWLKLNLQAQLPSRNFEVINCGGLSYASYRVLAILKEVLAYDPDLIVIDTGHNEFLERRSYDNWRLRSPRRDTIAWLAQMRVVQMVRAYMQPTENRPEANTTESARTVLAAEVDALLDYSGGLADYHRDDPWRAPVVEHFRWNLEQMIVQCLNREVPLLLVRPVSNLLDCPPFKFEIDSSLTFELQTEFLRAWEVAQTDADPNVAMEAVERALAIDPRHAGALFLKGRLLAEGGDWHAAKILLTAARDEDVCPLRAITPIANSVNELAEQYRIPCVDSEQLFADRSEHEIIGSTWLVDHVHPTIEGHQLLGEALAEAAVQAKITAPTNPNWEVDREVLYQQHLSGLGEDYFHRGKQRLEGLLLWTQGRAKKVIQN